MSNAPDPMMSKPTTSAEYLTALTDEQRAVVQQLLAIVRAAAPGAKEVFSYRMPGFSLNGSPLLWVAAWKRHYSVYPVSEAEVAIAAAPGDVFEAEKGTVRFPADAPIPYDLIMRLVQVRAASLAAEG